jgi:putative Ca2+/H+ antiporter (TMEM165/GDT1 family)
MDYKIFFTVFFTVFIAELGDKTQIATMLFAADQRVNKAIVFSGAALALVATSALGVLAGGVLARHVTEKNLQLLAGGLFVAIGIWTIVKAT